MAKLLCGLSLQEGSAAQCSHHLAELERLFVFSSTGLGSEVRDTFRTQLQEIPMGKGQHEPGDQAAHGPGGC